jgi:RNase P subunit RPR2
VCQSCGGAVSSAFRRTHGDQNDVVWACLQCAPKTHVKYLAGDPNATRRTPEAMACGDAAARDWGYGAQDGTEVVTEAGEGD